MPLQSIGMELFTHKSGNSVVLMRTFVEGIQDIIDVSPSLQLSEYSLLGKFINCLPLKLIEYNIQYNKIIMIIITDRVILILYYNFIGFSSKTIIVQMLCICTRLVPYLMVSTCNWIYGS
jgi:hypothetical protein